MAITIPINLPAPATSVTPVITPGVSVPVPHPPIIPAGVTKALSAVEATVSKIQKLVNAANAPITITVKRKGVTVFSQTITPIQLLPLI